MAPRRTERFEIGTRVVTSRLMIGAQRAGLVIDPTDAMLQQFHDSRDAAILWRGGRETWIASRFLRRA